MEECQKGPVWSDQTLFVLALPIFPGRLQPSIFGADELNYRVRNGNGWTLILISTNSALRIPPENLSNYKTTFHSCQEEVW